MSMTKPRWSISSVMCGYLRRDRILRYLSNIKETQFSTQRAPGQPSKTEAKHQRDIKVNDSHGGRTEKHQISVARVDIQAHFAFGRADLVAARRTMQRTGSGEWPGAERRLERDSFKGLG
ncbi:hypothetical protein MMC21_000781 [Puttea exsequens]|nr:hypothetical protein [Puttea exsequens]